MTHSNSLIQESAVTAGVSAGANDGNAARVTVAVYSAEEVVGRFHALYSCMDYKDILEDIGIGTFQLRRRKKALRDLRALTIALWGLALRRSFPDDADAFFAAYRESCPSLVRGDREAAEFSTRLNIYFDLLAEKKEADFQPVAEYLAEVLAQDAGDQRRLRLKLSLATRALYTMIFNKLV